MGFGIGLVVGAIIGFIVSALVCGSRVVHMEHFSGIITDKIDAYKESVDKAVGLIYEVAEKNKQLEAAKKEREFMEKMLKGEPGPDDWRRL